MDLRSRCNTYKTTDGIYAGTVWFCMPYRTLPVDMRIADLNAIDPQILYIHKQTGERTVVEPPDHIKAVERAVKLKSGVINSQWREVNRWNTIHTLFWQVEPVTIAIEFPDFDEQTPAEVRAFAELWQNRPLDVEDYWQYFRAVIGTDTANAWSQAYVETRDQTLLAPQVVNGHRDEKKSGKREKVVSDSSSE